MVLKTNRYFYHPDHLGSTSYITNAGGEVCQHVEYIPFGETLFEKDLNSELSPYLFNGKERDEATGLYYYGARYYDPKISLWLSVDPLAEDASNQSPYIFCSQDPINRIDDDGEWDIEVHTYKNRNIGPYALLIVKDMNGKVVYKTIVKTVGFGGRKRNVTYSDTPQGKYKILGWRKTGEGTRYNRTTYGPNDLLATDYLGGEGGKRNGMHVHGGRQEGKYKNRKELMETGGCMRISDKEIAKIKSITTNLEANNPNEKKGYLTVTDDLAKPIKSYSEKNSIINSSTSQDTSTYLSRIIDYDGDGYTYLRSNPGYGEKTRLNVNQFVVVLEKGTKFTKVSTLGKIGYVYTKYLEE